MRHGFRGFAATAAYALVLAVSTPADATPTLVGTTTDPTGIDNLLVDGTLYNVTFSTTTLNSFTYGSPLSAFASFELQSALNSLGVVGLGGTSVDVAFILNVDNTLSSTWEGTSCTVVLAPTTPSICTASTWLGASAGSGFVLGNNFAVSNGYLFYVEAADFTAVPTSTPEPITVSLFGAGLVGAVAVRRRKKNAA